MANTFIFKENKAIILIDTSILYLTVYLRTVKRHVGSYSRSRSSTLPESFDYKSLHKNVRFLNKLEENFISAMYRLLQIHKDADLFNVIFGRDTPQTRNWRKLEITSTYKAQRKLMEQYDPYVAQYFWNKIIPRFILNYGSKVLYYEPLEADDVIYLMTKRLREIYPSIDICIVTNDRDYLQLVSDRVTVY